ncbi:MAG TPA: DUF4340 domain-containing protein [Sedimenticola thiotaurini]|uniref:DUF4340 domain-containing protein n=1 Tax=Sedimenticola thiotaurini TaxID=1543721 RepID=A0A831RMS4_9GAMM|nr:DUF4340 domain-containing protein [Sedimenticola thiotaurini]
MSGRGRINLLLLLLVAGLGLAVWLTPPDTPPEAEPLTRLRADSVRHIRLSNRNGTELELQRRGDGWYMLRPYHLPANAGRIELLLGILSTPSHESFPLPDGDLDAFGLQPPLATLEVDGSRIEVGGTHPYNHDRYLRIGDRIHLIKDIFPHHLLAPAEAYVSPRLLPPGARIDAIETPAWNLRRGAAGWEYTPGTGGSQDPLVARVQAWEQARALQVIPEPEGVQTTGQVTIRLRGDASPLRFRVARRDGDLLLIRPGTGLAWRLSPQTSLLSPPGE